MSDLLNDLEPKLLWRYFLELSRIPRGSKREAEAARWVAEQGRALGCEVATDALGNVLIRKPGTKGREGRPGVCLQGHVDMVCEKNEGTPHDFTRDPIAVYRDGDVVRAWDDARRGQRHRRRRRLAALASDDVRHGPLEVLVTVDEETGLTGAKGIAAVAPLALPPEPRQRGGGGAHHRLRRRRRHRRHAQGRARRAGGGNGPAAPQDLGAQGRPLRDRHRRRPRQLAQILAQVLTALAARHGLAIAAVNGGNKRNAIPREASAMVRVEAGREAALRDDVAVSGASGGRRSAPSTRTSRSTSSAARPSASWRPPTRERSSACSSPGRTASRR